MMGARKMKWNEAELYDSDGCMPTPEQLIQAMREYQTNGCISDYWFYDGTDCEHEDPDDDDSRVWDDWNEEYRWPENVGPSPNEIDFTGLNEWSEQELSADSDAHTRLITPMFVVDVWGALDDDSGEIVTRVEYDPDDLTDMYDKMPERISEIQTEFTHTLTGLAAEWGYEQCPSCNCWTNTQMMYQNDEEIRCEHCGELISGDQEDDSDE